MNASYRGNIRSITLILMIMVALTITHAQGNTISIGQTVDGAITDQHFVNVWSFDGQVGMTVFLRIEEVSDGLDAHLTLLNPSGRVIRSNDDYEGNPDPQIEATLEVSGVHTILVTRYQFDRGASSGNYRLSLHSPNFGSTANNQPQLEVTPEVHDSQAIRTARPDPSFTVGSGVYIYTRGQLIRLERIGESDIRTLRSLPVISDTMPLFFYRNVALDRFFRVIPGIGASIDTRSGEVIFKVFLTDSHGPEAGLRGGDVITAVNGVPVRGDADFARELLTAGNIVDPVSVELSRGSGAVIIQVPRIAVDTTSVESRIINWDGDTRLVELEEQLVEGRYCFSYIRDAYCFDFDAEGSSSIPNEVTTAISEVISDGDVAQNALLLIKYANGGGLNGMDLACALNDNFQLWFPGERPVLDTGSVLCVWIEAGTTLFASGSPIGLIPILLDPEENVDPWLDQLNAYADSAPLTRFVVCSFLDRSQDFCEEQSR